MLLQSLPLSLLFLVVASAAQTSAKVPDQGGATAPLLSPGAAYQEALRPLTVIRASVPNWSPTERAALSVAMHQAATACAARASKNYTGDALIDLGHLCSMGQDWTASVDAADRYLGELPAEPSPARSTLPMPTRMADAYAIKLDGELHLKDEKSAFTTATEMLNRVPFSTVVEDAMAGAINYMYLLFTPDAEALAQARQPRLLAWIESSTAASDKPGWSENNRAGLPDLFAQALVLPGLQQLSRDPEGARESMTAVEAAIPATVSPDDAIAIDGWRRRYAQLGKPLGQIDALKSLTVPAKMPQIPAHRAITVLLLFPDWCAQCIRLAQQIPESVFSVEGHEAYMYGLLVQTVGPKKAAPPNTKSAPADPAQFDPADAATYLNGTSTVIVDAEMLPRFNAVDIPLLVVADSAGIVRFISPVDETALLPGNTVDSAVARVGNQWPSQGATAQDVSRPGAPAKGR